MYFDSFSEFLIMGGYAVYVWAAFGITFGSLALLFLVSWLSQGRVLQEVQNRMERQARIEAAKKLENTL